MGSRSLSLSVSVVMPSLGQGTWIEEAIASVLQEPDLPLELIVADGGSSDDTLAILDAIARNEPRLRWFSSPDNGPAEALNRAVALARGTLIGWLNADDRLLPGALSRAVEAMRLHPQWLMVYGEGEHVDAQGRFLETYPTRPPDCGLEGFRDHCFICQPTVLWRRTLSLRLGPFDTSLRTAFDFDYWLRAFATVPDRIGYLPHRQAQTRLHGASITHRRRALVLQEALQLTHRSFGCASAHLIDNYALELHRSRQDPAEERDIAAAKERAIQAAEPWLAAGAAADLRSRWQLDPRTAPLRQAIERCCEELALPQRLSVRLIAAVHPALLELAAAPPASAHTLLLHWLLLGAWGQCQLLRQDQGLWQAVAAQGRPLAVPLPALVLWHQDAGLQHHHPLPQDAAGLSLWWHRSAEQLLKPVRLAVSGDLLASPPATPVIAFQQRPFGVNLIGHAVETLGVAEDLRMAARALEAAGVPWELVPIANPGAAAGHDLPPSRQAAPNSWGRYAFTLVLLAPADHAALLAREGFGIVEGRYTIAAWPWETDLWPTPWAVLLEVVDEMWANSSLIETALKPAARASGKPLLHLPPAVAVDRPIPSQQEREALRQQHGLPMEGVLFGYGFDPRSWLARKNPQGLIEAFQRAFPAEARERDRPAVSLLLKTLPLADPRPEWQALRQRIAQDRRIHLIEADLPRAGLLDLLACCDVYVSLHRSEGFGRTLAEALQLGLTVIASDHGGNRDFCHSPMALTVPCQRRPIGLEDYPHPQGQSWGEPDLEIAVTLMRQQAERCHSGTESRDWRLIEAERQRFSPISVGERYRARLQALWQDRAGLSDQLASGKASRGQAR